MYYYETFNKKLNSVQQKWKSLGHIFNPSRKTKPYHIDKILYENREIHDKQEIADSMNEYFVLLVKKLANEQVGNNFQRYLTCRIQESFYLSSTSEYAARLELKRLNPRKSAGADEISPKILKLSGDIIAYPLMFIFNKAMEDATYPNRMKIAKVPALFKKHPKYVHENYRPISLLPSLDKTFEKRIYKRSSLFIEKHTILYL